MRNLSGKKQDWMPLVTTQPKLKKNIKFYKEFLRTAAQDLADSQKNFSLKKERKYPHKHASFCFISTIKAQEIDG